MSGSLVIDSCVALKWFVDEHDSTSAHRLLTSDLDLVAPDLILVELANAFRKNARLQRMPVEQLERAMETAHRIFTTQIASSALIDEALLLARDIDHPVYDCIYVVAARRAGAPLVTSDSRLVAKVAGTSDKDRVILLEHWKP